MRRHDINWEQIQSDYNNGLTWREIQKKFNLCSATLAWGRKNNYLTCRTLSEATILSWKNGKQKAETFQTPKHRKIMSKFGGYKENSGRCKHISFAKKDGKIVKLQGTWEEKLAMFLDEKDIKWERNRVGYKYQFKNKEHQYFPDFYLPEHKIYIEVKGYETERDKAKWSEFPFKLFIVKKQEIQDLTAWLNKIKL
jgi:hypothetical protein